MNQDPLGNQNSSEERDLLESLMADEVVSDDFSDPQDDNVAEDSEIASQEPEQGVPDGVPNVEMPALDPPEGGGEQEPGEESSVAKLPPPPQESTSFIAEAPAVLNGGGVGTAWANSESEEFVLSMISTNSPEELRDTIRRILPLDDRNFRDALDRLKQDGKPEQVSALLNLETDAAISVLQSRYASLKLKEQVVLVEAESEQREVVQQKAQKKASKRAKKAVDAIAEIPDREYENFSPLPQPQSDVGSEQSGIEVPAANEEAISQVVKANVPDREAGPAAQPQEVLIQDDPGEELLSPGSSGDEPSESEVPVSPPAGAESVPDPGSEEDSSEDSGTQAVPRPAARRTKRQKVADDVLAEMAREPDEVLTEPAQKRGQQQYYTDWETRRDLQVSDLVKSGSRNYIAFRERSGFYKKEYTTRKVAVKKKMPQGVAIPQEVPTESYEEVTRSVPAATPAPEPATAPDPIVTENEVPVAEATPVPLPVSDHYPMEEVPVTDVSQSEQAPSEVSPGVVSVGQTFIPEGQSDQSGTGIEVAPEVPSAVPGVGAQMPMFDQTEVDAATSNKMSAEGVPPESRNDASSIANLAAGGLSDKSLLGEEFEIEQMEMRDIFDSYDGGA